ncbi:hypothetical protein [Azospirillum sp. B2RO_4]|uniref:hypothetical protein n=1 Tax=Azospirillum sp. B2RO_4 TaxID=3027796 RepID=UPI003DA7B2B9
MVTLVKLGTSRVFAADGATAPRFYFIHDADAPPSSLSLKDTAGKGRYAVVRPRAEGRTPAQIEGLMGPPRPDRKSSLRWFARDDSRLAELLLTPQADRTATDAVLAMRNLSLYLGDRARVEVLDDRIRFTQDPATPTFGAVRLIAGGDDTGVESRIDLQTDTGAVGLEILADGPMAGCCAFRATLDADALTALRIDIRYFVKHGSDIDDPRIARARALRFPVLDATASLDVQAVLDPLDVEDHARSRLRLVHAKDDSGVPTAFATAHGHRVNLRSVDDGSAIVFVPSLRTYKASTAQPVDRPGFAATFSGAFALHVPGDDGSPGWPEEHLLVTGNLGTEFMPFVPERPDAPGDHLVFDPNNPAFLRDSDPSLPALASDDDPNAPGTALSGIARTAWAGLQRHGSRKAAYVAQPEDAPLFGHAEGPGLAAEGPALLPFSKVPLLQSPTSTPLVPLLPLASVAGAAARFEEAVRWERSVLAGARRKLMRAANRASQPGFAAETGRWVTTPQGFLVRIVDNRWQEIKIAVGEPDQAANTDANTDRRSFLRIERPPVTDWILEDALQRDRVFLVVSRLKAEDLGTVYLETTVAGWRVKIDLGSAGGTGTGVAVAPTLVFKFRDGAARDLLNDPATWARAKSFNDSPEAQAASIQALLDRYKADGPAAIYAPLFDRLEDPAWNGVLALNVEPSGFPKEAVVLAAGLKELDRFRCRYFGVDYNRIRAEGSLDMERSSLFGLIHYRAPENRPPPTGDYEYVVTYLSVLLDNSKIVKFDSEIEFHIGSIFGGRTSAETSRLLLKGYYEDRGGTGTYTFLNEQPHTVTFKSFPVIKALTVSRLQLGAVVTPGPTGEEQSVKARFGLWGGIEFSQLGGPSADLLSLKSLTFGDAAVTAGFTVSGKAVKGLTFGVDLASMSVDAQVGDLRDGLLSRLPFKLSGFLWPGAGDGRLTMPDLGYVPLGFGLPEVPAFHFGLEFKLDLGSLGSLISAAKRLGARVVIGWPDFNKPPVPSGFPLALGFKLDGGSGPLDIGLQGILKLSARDVLLDTGGSDYRLVLVDCVLEALGRKLPEAGTLNVIFFAPPKQPEKFGWFGSLLGAGGAPLRLDYLALGQRVDPDPKREFTGSTHAVVAAMRKAFGEIKAAKDITPDKIKFDADAGWTVALSAALGTAATVELVLIDRPPALYGLRVRIPGEGAPALFDIDVIYRRITDEIGVFAADIQPPDTFRTLELGAASVILGNLGIEAYSNGNWKLELGFPKGQDFSRSFNVQVLPFIGYGGAYFARKTSATSALITKPGYDPVIEVGLAFRVGLGKEIRRGPFHAGASLTVYGVLEGAFAREAAGSQTHFRLIGRAGVLAEIFGAVDFGIIKAAVVARAFAEIGVDYEQNRSLVLWIEAGVSVSVTVVIGRIRIWGATIEISISFGFSTQISYRWELPERGAALAAASDVIAWGAFPYFQKIGRPKAALSLAFTLDVTQATESGRIESRVVPLLVLLRPADGPRAAERDLVHALLAFAVAMGIGDQGHSPLDWTVTGGQLARLAERLDAGSLSRAGLAPLDYGRITAFLADNFDVSVAPTPREGKHLGTFVPMLPDATLVLSRDGDPASVLQSVAFWDDGHTPTHDDGYERQVRDFFQKMMTTLELRAHPAMAAVSSRRTLATIAFEDWVAMLVKGVVDRARSILEAQTTAGGDWRRTAAPLGEIMGKIGDAEAGALLDMAARFFLHGLRPPRDGAPGCAALFDLLGQQIPGVPRTLPAGDTAYDVRLEARHGVGWFRTAGPLVHTVEVAKIAAAQALAPDPGIKVFAPLPVFETRPRSVRLAMRDRLQTAGVPSGRSLWPLPAPLVEELRTGWSGTAFQLTAVEHARPGAPERAVVVGGWTWATRIELGVRPVFGNAPETGTRRALPGLYELVGTDTRSRLVLERLLGEDRALLQDATLRVAYRKAKDTQLTVDDADPGVLLVKTNLSPKTLPPVDTGAPGFAAVDAADDAAAITSAAGFLRLVRECSVTNAPGFTLRYAVRGTTPLDDLLRDAGGERASIQLLIEYAGGTERARGVFDAVFAAEPDAGRSLVAVLPEQSTSAAAVEPGCLTLRVERTEPNPAASENEALAAQFNLLDFAIAGSAAFQAVPPDEILPFGPTDAGPPAAGRWRYRLSIPLYRFAAANAGKPRADVSPYAAIGETATIRLGLRDCYGNRLDIADATATTTITVLYTDEIPAPAEWPAVALSYRPDPARAGRIEVCLAFAKGWADPPAGEPDPRARLARIEAAIGSLRHVVHVLRAPGVSVAAEVRAQDLFDGKDVLRASAPIPINTLVTFVEGVIAALGSGHAPPPVCASVDVSALAGVGRPVSALVATVLVNRRPELVHPEATAVGATKVHAVASVVSPAVTGDTDDAWRRFAEAFETTVAGIRIARAVDRRGRGGLHVVRPNLLVANSLSEWPSPAFFAPRPLSTTLRSGNVLVRVFRDDDTPDLIPATVTDVDLDARAADFLAAVESVLTPACAVACWQIDGSAMARVMGAKRTLAQAFAERATPILKASARPEPLHRRAVQTLREEFLGDLTAVYRVSTLIQFALAPASQGTSAPRIFGRPAFVDPKPAPASAQLGSAKIETAPADTAPSTGSPAGGPVLNILLTPDADNAHAMLTAGLRVLIDYIEVPEPQDPGLGGYRGSRWFRLLTGKDEAVPLSTPSGRRWDIPIPLRRFPPPPVALGHAAQAGRDLPEEAPPPTPPKPSTPADHVTRARAWSYRIDYGRSWYAQDTAILSASYSAYAPARLAGEGRGPLDCLVSFHRHWPALSPLLLGLSKPVAPGAAEAVRSALRRFAQLVEEVANALGTVAGAAFAEATASDKATLTESFGGGQLAIAACLDRQPVPRARRILPLALDETGQPVPPKLVMGDRYPCVTTLYAMPNAPKPGTPVRRRVVFGDLDALREQVAWGAVDLLRNANIATSPELVNDQFLYRTGSVGVGRKIGPRLEYATAINLADDPASTPAESLETKLVRFFGTLFDRAEGQLLAGTRVEFASALGATVDHPRHDAWVRLPVLFCAPTPVDAGGAALARTLGQGVASWLARNRVAPTAGGRPTQFRFEIVVMAETERERVPILLLRNVFLETGTFA